MTSDEATELYRRLKMDHPAQLQSEGHAAMERFSEQQFLTEKWRLEERRRRLDPVYCELVTALRKSSDLAGVVRAVDALARSPRPTIQLPQPAKRLFVPSKPPAKPLIQGDWVTIVESLPFFSNTWNSEDGNNNSWDIPPTADGTTGDMSYRMRPGISSSGHMACWAALYVQLAIPNRPCYYSFTANPSVSWWYAEKSEWWREAAGNMWIGQLVNLFDAAGNFICTAVNTQNSVASFDDRNLGDESENAGSNSSIQVSSSIAIGFSGLTWSQPASAEGGFVQCACWIGGSANADGTNDQSASVIQMNAKCSSMTIQLI
jgi:hypothetical protein